MTDKLRERAKELIAQSSSIMSLSPLVQAKVFELMLKLAGEQVAQACVEAIAMMREVVSTAAYEWQQYVSEDTAPCSNEAYIQRAFDEALARLSPKPIQAHSKTVFKRLLEQGANVVPPADVVPMDGWLPIESAPKDKNILLSDGAVVSEGGWISDEAQGAEYEGQFGNAAWWSVAGIESPTLWQPIPNPPVLATAAKAE